MAEKTNVPEIRFAGFTDPWEQRKLGELYSLVSEKNDLTFGRESIISVANMYFNAIVNVTDEQYLRTYNVMRLGDIAFEGHSNKEFSHGRFVENYIGDGIVSHIFTVLRPRVPFDVNYWRYAINNEKLMRLSLIRSTKASTMMHDLVPSDFLREAIPTPTLAEQKEIGAFLVGLDHLITLHQRKYDKLAQLKKSMLDKMFPKPGERFPEIRFAGFTDPWEQRKLGDIAPVTMGQSPNGACYTDNPNDAVLVQGNADLKDGWVFPRVWTTEITKTAKAGDLIMSVRAPVGAMGKTAYDVVLGRGVAGIAGNEFLFQALSKKEAEGYWSTVSAGSTFDSINGDELRNTPVDYPRSKQEREAVGSCLSRIDCLITLHQREPPHAMKEGKNANRYQWRIAFLRLLLAMD